MSDGRVVGGGGGRCSQECSCTHWLQVRFAGRAYLSHAILLWFSVTRASQETGSSGAEEAGKAWATKHGMPHFATSARTRQGMNEAMLALVDQVRAITMARVSCVAISLNTSTFFRWYRILRRTARMIRRVMMTNLMSSLGLMLVVVAAELVHARSLYL